MRSKVNEKRKSAIFAALSSAVPKCLIRIILDYAILTESEKLVGILSAHSRADLSGKIRIHELMEISWSDDPDEFEQKMYHVSILQSPMTDRYKTIRFRDMLPSRGSASKILRKAGYEDPKKIAKKYYWFMSTWFACFE
jgi:hypothetical protein